MLASNAPPPAPSEQSSTTLTGTPHDPEQPEETPGPRASRLVQLYDQALDRTLSKLAYANLAMCYPTIAAKAEPMLVQVQSQMVDKLGEKCRREFEGIVEGRGVVRRLNELERLVGEAGARKAEGEDGVAPHLLPPDEILAAHMHPALTGHQSQLNARLQTTQSQNTLLHEEILVQRREIEELVGKLENVLGDVRGANGVLGEVVEVLGKEAVEGRRFVDEAGQ